jgi:penicillin-binding protein 1B
MNENTSDLKTTPPSGFLQRPRARQALIASAALLTLAIIIFGVWIYRLDHNIKTRFAEKRFLPPVEFYSAPEVIRPGSKFPKGYFEAFFQRRNYRKREFSEPIREGDYSIWNAAECVTVVGTPVQATPQGANQGTTTNLSPGSSAVAAPAPSLTGASDLRPPSAANGSSAGGMDAPAPPPPAIQRCIAFKGQSRSAERDQGAGVTETSDPLNTVRLIVFGVGDEIIGVYSGAKLQAAESIEIEPELFAQYFGENPTLRTVVPLGAAPTMCLNSLLAIEDSGFLQHSGVSVTGLLRAALTDLRSGKRTQGGSTITQQLVKNFFLNDQKTLSRKLTEIAMAFLVERHATKDEILETYINLIYMGQNGPFQVRGFAAAANHYFGKPLSDLNLDQCALLAAVLNSPGLFNPFQHPDHALKRRGLVLDRMSELKMITPTEAQAAKAAPLPSKPQRNLTEPAPYFVQGVRRFMQAQNLDESEGLRVYTTLNLRAQEAAHQSVRAGLDRLEKNFTNIQKLKAQGKNLEAVLISSDPLTGAVQALVGGRGFLATQFNRALDSRRQVGSIMKPFVYLTALEHRQEDGSPYTPVSTVKDVATTHRFEGQTWTPHNYEGTYEGDVPMYFALKESLNAATVNLGMAVGLGNIVDTAQRMGVTSKIKPLPSLTLGAFELSPMEVLESYSGISRLGMRTPLTLVTSIEDLTGRKLFEFKAVPEQVVAAETAAELVGIMKQTIFSGTGRGVKLGGFSHPAAGKTGTTNDKKDAWFAGFTPFHTAIVWVGYDDNTSHGLTGATGAVPIWTSYMKTYGATFPPTDFVWPTGVEKVLLSAEKQALLGVPEKKGLPPEPAELIFIKGQVPPQLQ